MPEPIAPVTGIARAGLGTATNLDDTQRYTLEDLVPESSPAIESSDTIAFANKPIEFMAWVDPRAAVEPVVSIVTPTTKPRAPRARRTGAGVPRHVIAMGSFAVIALAIALTVRDGALGGPESFGGGFGGQDAVTGGPRATDAPAPTAAPAATPKGKSKGHGHGGHGH